MFGSPPSNVYVEAAKSMLVSSLTKEQKICSQIKITNSVVVSSSFNLAVVVEDSRYASCVARGK